jgi:hypothetical protein
VLGDGIPPGGGVSVGTDRRSQRDQLDDDGTVDEADHDEDTVATDLSM